MDRPVPFTGTDDERAANFATHSFMSFDDDAGRCAFCDCKEWHVAASYPCGEEPPREDVDTEYALAEQQSRFLTHAYDAELSRAYSRAADMNAEFYT